MSANGASPDAEDVVLIIGSGSTGLALAQGLKKAKVKSIVFEKHAKTVPHARDWNLGLHWGAPVLKSLIPPEAWDNLQSIQVDPHVPTKAEDSLKFINGATGELMTSFTIDHFYRLRRSKLRDLLSEGLDVRYNKQLSDITYSENSPTVTAKFSDGSSVTGRLLVGADGARSTVRRLLFGPEAGRVRRLPYAATFVQARFSRQQALYLRKWHNLYLGSAHPDGYFAFLGMQDVLDPSRPETWTFFFYISWNYTPEQQDKTAGWSNAERLKQVKEIAKTFADPWKSAFEWTPDNHPVWYMGLTDWDPGAAGHRWHNHGGRVTLVGDAAHAMTYQRGQGLNHSITDAGKLTVAIERSLGTEQQADSIAAFEEEMIVRSGDEVRLSTTNTAMLHDWERVLKSPVMTKGMKYGVKHKSA